MKRILTTTALLMTLGTASFAAGHAQVQADLDARGIEADASALSENELARLEVVLNGSFSSPAAQKGRIMTILEGADAMKVMPGDGGRVMVDLSMNSLRTQVDNRLSAWNVDCDVYALSDAQVTEAYLAINSSMSDTEAQNAAIAACQS